MPIATFPNTSIRGLTRFRSEYINTRPDPFPVIETRFRYSRRTRSLLLDARAGMEAASAAAVILASELGRDEAWQRQQVETFAALAKGYLIAGKERKE